MVHASFTFPSRVLGRNTDFQVLLPRPQSLYTDAAASMDFTGKKCVWFFHGVSDNAQAVVTHTDLAALCDQLDFIAVLPSVENSFCLDVDATLRFRTYLLEELFPYVKRLLSLSERREDQIVGGISMGGYGACSLGLGCPELFSKVFCLSGALDMRMGARFARACGIPLAAPLIERDVLERHPDWDLLQLLDRAAAGGEKIPPIWMVCSELDAVFKSNLSFAQRGAELGLAVELHRAPGLHDWAFWRENLPAALDWALRS